jgi:ATP-dependent RNA helicase DDX23/PRP28
MSSGKRERSRSPPRRQHDDDRYDQRNSRDSRDDRRYHDRREYTHRGDNSPQRRRYRSPERSNYRQERYYRNDSRRREDSGDEDNFEEEFIVRPQRRDPKEPISVETTIRPQNHDIMNTGIDPNHQSTSNPVSLDDLRLEKERREIQESKPVFRSKMERRMDKMDILDEKKKKIDDLRQEREKMLQERHVPSQYDQQTSKLNNSELEDLKKSYYMEKEKVEKKPIDRSKDKSKFKFEWDQSEDTSHDINPIYDKKHEYHGRATRGGQESNATNHVTKTLEHQIHWSKKSLEEMSNRDWRIFNEDNEIQTKGGNILNPIRSWKESKLPSDILKIIDKLGYEKPTPIQMQCIPMGLTNRDMIGLSETGSGKTIAYLLPLLVYVSKMPKLNQFNCHDGPYSLILAPTRELALQIEEEARKFTEILGIKVVSVIGGVSQDNQSYALRDGCEILIATPGRLMAYLEQRILVLNQCNYVVLDECDKMISMGFEEQVNTILDHMPSSNLKPEEDTEDQGVYRQTIMFSATMPKEIERLAAKYMRRKVVVMIGEVGRTVKKIEQRIEFLEDHAKRNRLLSVLESNEGPIIVFVNLKKAGDSLQKFLHGKGYRSLVLHGKKSQDARNYALDSFKSGNIDVLIATDVMSRGIDIEGVKLVVNYDMPNNIEDYKHRIGRTGRAGKDGLAISFLTREDTGVFYDLKQTLTQAEQYIPEELAHHPAALIRPGSMKEII